MHENPTPVSVGIIPGTKPGHIVLIERADGGIALPGGFVERLESGFVALSRELEEETGLVLETSKWQIFWTDTSPGNIMLLFSHYPEAKAAPANFVPNKEVVRVFEAPWNTPLKFPLHEEAVRRWAVMTNQPVPSVASAVHVGRDPEVYIIGPRDRGALGESVRVVNVTSSSVEDKAFSPFYLGPAPLYGGRTAQKVENGWQFAKVYRAHVGADGNPNADYWAWAEAGWASRTAARYPMGKGAKPEYLFWDGEKLGYIDARLQVYWPMYRDAVKNTDAFKRLQCLAQEGPLALWDFDGYNHDAYGISLGAALRNEARPLGHAFVLKAMLLFGPDVTPEEVFRAQRTPRP
jgi:ADP-ribose pyrophosphatase YjhB (NUDIX family)